MRRASVALLPLAAIAAFAQTPTSVTATTKYGTFEFFNIEVIRVEQDRPCGFAARVENHTGTTWNKPVFSVKVGGRAADGTLQSFEIEARSEYLGNAFPADRVSGRCTTDRPDISTDRFEIALVSGQPDLEILQRAAALAKLPLVSSGDPNVFIGSDRKCAEEFQQALTMEGLEKRKRLLELVTYGCGFLSDSPVHAAVLKREGSFALVALAEGDHEGKSGWVPAAWVK